MMLWAWSVPGDDGPRTYVTCSTPVSLSAEELDAISLAMPAQVDRPVWPPDVVFALVARGAFEVPVRAGVA